MSRKAQEMPTIEEAEQKYIIENLTRKQVAAFFNVGFSTMNNFLTKHKIAKSNNTSDPKRLPYSTVSPINDTKTVTADDLSNMCKKFSR